MIKAGIIGSTGYAGQELVRLLMQHPDVEIVWYGSRSYIDQQYADVFQNMFQIVDAKKPHCKAGAGHREQCWREPCGGGY